MPAGQCYHHINTNQYAGSTNQFTGSYMWVTLAFNKDIHREKAPSNKTPALRKSTNMGVWAVGTLNQ